jgi:hypothetical protein
MLNKLDEVEEVDRKRTWCQQMAADDLIALG